MNQAVFALVKNRLETELENIRKLEQELRERELLASDRKRRHRLMDQFVVRAVGSVLHDFYMAVENMFKAVARNIDKSIPEGEDWHQELLTQMSIPIPGVRIALIDPDLKIALDEFRSFRHVFRNVYGFNLVAERFDHLLKIFPDVVNQLSDNISAFLVTMQETMMRE